LNLIPDLDPTYVVLSAEDYSAYSAPRWARSINHWHADYILRQKTKVERKQQFDILWVQGWENAVTFQDLAQRIPAVAMMDAVPATINSQRRERGFDNWKHRLAHQLRHRAFRSAAAKFQYFLPMTSDCALSLERDYGAEPGRSYVTLAPQDFERWAPRARSFAPPWRLLFVGNDFERKGGDFLLQLYSRHLAEACTLTIVSNDPVLHNRQLPAGVFWIRGATPEQVRDAYWNSQLFLFPTRQDFAPQVLAEALSAGLPSLATGVGGVSDLVRNGETGFILPRQATLEQWAARIHSLLDDPEQLRTMSVRARRSAEELLDAKRFDQLVSKVIDRLRATI
jgi:glycosyltransferase involved in cell wall biosynthesis